MKQGIVMNWMLKSWFSIVLFVFACLFAFLAEICRYYLVFRIILILIFCILIGGLAYIADLHKKNNNKKLAQLNKGLIILFALFYSWLILTLDMYIIGPNSPHGRIKTASPEEIK